MGDSFSGDIGQANSVGGVVYWGVNVVSRAVVAEANLATAKAREVMLNNIVDGGVRCGGWRKL